MIKFLRARLPSLADFLRVASVAMVFLYGWTIVTWMWQLPSWMLSLTLDEILSIFAYAMLDALTESLVVLACLLIPTVILPPRLLRDDFTVRASWSAIGLLAPQLIFFMIFIRFGYGIALYLLPWTFATLALTVLLPFLSTKLAFMRAFALWLSDRLQVFLYIFIPLTVISLVVVLIRNLT